MGGFSVKLSDLYFIEDKKHRRAFWRALKEIDEEGYEVASKKDAAAKILNVEIKSATEQKKAIARDNKTELQGETPASLSKLNKIRAQSASKYTKENSVDMKDYKNWRQDEYNKIKERENKKFGAKEQARKFDFDDEPREKKKPSLYEELFGGRSGDSGVQDPAPRKKPSLYEELFGDAKDHEAQSHPKTKSYEFLDTLDEEQQKEKRIQAFKTARSEVLKREGMKRRVSNSSNLDISRQTNKENNGRKAKALSKEEYNDDASNNSETIKSASNDTNSEPAKIVVEVVDPAKKPETKVIVKEKIVEKPVIVEVTKEVPKKSPARKPRGKSKRKKGLDADIKRYHKIVID